MWIIMPLIYFMSWRSCRRIGQAFSETAAWVIGYFISTGILLALHFGGVGMISATPDDPAAILALMGGFAGMAVSRYFWKRRGGHLEPARNPLANNRWFRAARAIVAPTRTKSNAKTTPSRQPTARRTTTSTASTPTRTASPKRTTPSSTSRTNKSSAERWGRAIGAMLTPPDSQRRPPQ